jgi:hypothetical protein
LGVTERTIARWHHFREGPPRVEFGRKVFYRLESVKVWLEVASIRRREPIAESDRVRRASPESGCQRNSIKAGRLLNDKPLQVQERGRFEPVFAKKSATSTSRARASFTIVASEGLRLPRRICDRCPFEKSVSR